MRTRPESTRSWITLGTAAFLVAASNAPFWSRLLHAAPVDSVSSAIFVASVFAALVALLHACLTLVSFRWVLKPIAIFVLLTAALAGYFMSEYGVVIDHELIQSALETDAREVGDLLTTQMLAHLLLLGLLPALLVTRIPLRLGPARREARRRIFALVGSLAFSGIVVGAQFKHFALAGREHSELRQLINPVGPIRAAIRYASSSRRSSRPLERIGLDARRAVPAAKRDRHALVVLVVGETARAANFELNGYSRATNPQLRQLPVLSFSRMSSCGTATAASLPCMFSAAGSDTPSGDAENREGLLDVLQRAGVSVLWRDNNSGCKHTCDRVPTQSRVELARSGECEVDGECLDEVLLSGLQARLDALHGDALIVLHQQGSHGPAYYKRSPDTHKAFFPECTGASLQSCSREAIVNAYDNSILYTDHVLAELIALLQANAARFDPVMWYVSDHGESLGENGIYLHGLPRLIAPEEQTHIPMILWFSPGSQQRLGLDRGCLERSAAEPHSHDELFHSLLGLFDVSTSVYRPERDWVAPCRTGTALVAAVAQAGEAVERRTSQSPTQRNSTSAAQIPAATGTCPASAIPSPVELAIQ